MEPKNNRFGGGATVSLLHPLVAIAVLVAIVLILTLSRKKAIIPFLLAVLNIPWGQVLVIGGVHFPMMRLLILAGLTRAAFSKAFASEKWFETGFSRIDQAVVLWTVFGCIVVTLQWMNEPMLVASLGGLVDALGGYVVLRFLIPDGEAIRRAIVVLAAICAIHGICMINEQVTGLNVFSLVGGLIIPDSIIRDGHLRSSAIMGPLGEGVFAGVLVPLFIWLWGGGKSRMAAMAGLAGAAAILITSHASSPWMACGAALLGLSFWRLRKHMRMIRWGFVLMLIPLQMVMKNPFWHLIDRVNLTGDSSSYHRYMLVDTTVRHFSDWWLLGYKNYNAWGWDMWDTSNLFVATALTGGLISLVFLIMAFSRSFGAIGAARKRVNGDREQEWLLWCLGSALFSVLVSSFGIAFLYQSQVAVFALFGCIAVVAFEAQRVSIEQAEPRAELRFPSTTRGATSDFLNREGGRETGKRFMRA